MANHHLAPKMLSSNQIDGYFNISKNPVLGNNSQTTPRFRPKIQTSTTPKSNPERYKEKMMTLKRSHNGDTEIKFPIRSNQFVQETQKLFNKYFSNEEVNVQTLEQKYDTSSSSTDHPSVTKNSDVGKRFKSGALLTPKKVFNSVIKSTHSNSRENSVAKKDSIKENTLSENVIDRKVIHLIGYVEHVMKWDQALKSSNISVVYSVLGTFINTINGSYPMEKCIFVRGSNGTVLECSFFEVDRPCPVMTKGQFVACFGQMIGAQKLRLYDIQILEESERNETQRAVFLSQRMTQELHNIK